MRDPASFLLLADEGGICGMAVGMQGLADDGAGPPIQDLCHVGAVFVTPGRWGAGLERYAEILDHCAFLRRGTMRRAYHGAPELMLQGQHLEGGSTPLTTALVSVGALRGGIRT